MICYESVSNRSFLIYNIISSIFLIKFGFRQNKKYVFILEFLIEKLLVPLLFKIFYGIMEAKTCK